MVADSSVNDDTGTVAQRRKEAADHRVSDDIEVNASIVKAFLLRESRRGTKAFEEAASGHGTESVMQQVQLCNPFNFNIRSCKSGSIVKGNFLSDWSYHFVEHLPSYQGKDGEWCFLLLDHHVSRDHPGAM